MAPGESDVFIPGEFAPHRPNFHIGYHNSERNAPPTDIQYGNLLNQGVSSHEEGLVIDDWLG
jgi:protein arginine N-methyltransferase 5